MLKRALLTALAGLALAAPAAVADSEWSLVFEAQGTLDIHMESKTGETRTDTSDQHAGFSWRSEMHGIRFDDEGRLVDAGEGTTTPAGKGSYESLTVIEGREHVVSCSYRGAAATWPNYKPKVTADASIAGPDAKEVLAVRPFDWLGIVLPCTGSTGYPMSHTIGYPISSNGQTDVNHAFAALITMPKDALAQGKVIHVVESFAPRANRSCVIHPGFECSLVWKGEITLTRSKYAPPPPGADDDVAPLPPPLPDPPAPREEPRPAPAPPPAEGDDDLLFPLVPPAATAPKATKATVDAAARSASATVTCAAACTGTVKAMAGKRALATARFSAAAGRPTKVKVRLPASARRVVKRARGIKLVVAVKAENGSAVSRTVLARLR
jgi:hypothetical protein